MKYFYLKVFGTDLQAAGGPADRWPWSLEKHLQTEHITCLKCCRWSIINNQQSIYNQKSTSTSIALLSVRGPQLFSALGWTGRGMIWTGGGSASSCRPEHDTHTLNQLTVWSQQSANLNLRGNSTVTLLLSGAELYPNANSFLLKSYRLNRIWSIWSEGLTDVKFQSFWLLGEGCVRGATLVD